MCGRFNVESDPLSRLLLELVRLRHPGPDNHNAAPTESIAVLRLDRDGAPELLPMRWWLTPYWAKEVGTRYAMFNARAESVERSPAFREPFRKRRCVVPVSGFYEWSKQAAGAADRRKLPYYIHPHELPGMLLAGIWDRWRNPADGEVMESFAIVTTAAAKGLAFVHSRQPVMLSLAGARRWLDVEAGRADLESLLRPWIPVELDAVPVSSYVNNARNKEARCVEPIAAPVAVSVDLAP
jgi:putative SOS response-associated peptidase YedK